MRNDATRDPEDRAGFREVASPCCGNDTEAKPQERAASRPSRKGQAMQTVMPPVASYLLAHGYRHGSPTRRGFVSVPLLLGWGIAVQCL